MLVDLPAQVACDGAALTKARAQIFSAVGLGVLGVQQLVTSWTRGDWLDMRDFCNNRHGMLVT